MLLRSLIFFIACLGITNAQAFSLDLALGEWHVLSVPGTTQDSILDLFDGELSAGEFNDTWSVYVLDEQTQDYLQPSVTATLEPGSAFWFIHYSDSSVSAEVNLSNQTVPLTSNGGCPTQSMGCFEHDLPVADNLESWSILGTPFPEGVMVEDIVLVTSAGPCADGCNLQEAFEANLLSSGVYSYDVEQNDYTQLTASEFMEPGEGYWFPTTISAAYGPASLLVPTYCSPLPG